MHTCIPSQGLKRSWHSCPRQVTAGNKNTPSMHHPQRRNVTIAMVGLKTVTCAKISPKMVNPRDVAGNTEEEEEEEEEAVQHTDSSNITCTDAFSKAVLLHSTKHNNVLVDSSTHSSTLAVSSPETPFTLDPNNNVMVGIHNCSFTDNK